MFQIPQFLQENKFGSVVIISGDRAITKRTQNMNAFAIVRFVGLGPHKEIECNPFFLHQTATIYLNYLAPCNHLIAL